MPETNLKQLQEFREKAKTAEDVEIKFVPPKGPSPAELRLQQMDEAINQLPKEEKEEVQYVIERLAFLRVKYGSSADLAIVKTSILISKERGQ